MVDLGNFLTITEKEIKNTVTFVNSSLPLVIGDFEWGAVEYPQIIQSLRDFEEIYGKPYTVKEDGSVILNNEKEWFTVDNMFSYGSSVLVNRILDTDNSFNSHINIPKNSVHKKVGVFDYTNLDEGVTSISEGDILVTDNSVSVEIDTVNELDTDEYSITLINLSGVINADDTFSFYGIGTEELYTLSIKEDTVISDDYPEFDNSIKAIIKNETEIQNESFVPVLGSEDLIKIYSRYAGRKGNDIHITYCNSLAFEDYKYVSGRNISREFSVSSINPDEIAILVLLKNSNGTYSILERHIVSLDTESKDSSGNSLFIENYLLQNSAYIYGFINSENVDLNPSDAFYFETPIQLIDGISYKADLTKFISVISDLKEYNLYNFKYIVDCGFLMGDEYKKALIDLAEHKKTCIAMLGLDISNVSSVISGTKSSGISKIKQWFKDFGLRSTYYAIAGEYKYKFNRYSGKYFWTHMADDLAGINIYSDRNYSPYNSAMGIDFGLVRDRNISRLGINYSGELLDEVYKTGINPFVLDDEGIICFGNRTGHSDNTSDYSSLHIRRLLIFIESNLMLLGKRIIGTNNDEFTRNSFIDGTSDYLDRIKANRGIYDYLVICDETNNTPSVIDNKEFYGDIYIKPTKLSEFVKINIINVSNSISFDEII